MDMVKHAGAPGHGRLVRVVLSVVGLGLVAAGVTAPAAPAGASAAAGSAAALPKGWRVTYRDPANVGSLQIVALSGRDGWAAGGKLLGYDAEGDPHYSQVLLHWNGRSWKRENIAGRAPEGLFNTLTASSGNDAWAFSTAPAPLENGGPDLARWNGKRWRWVPGAITQIPAAGEVDAAADIGPSDVWESCTFGPATLAHWNGSRWRADLEFGLSQTVDDFAAVSSHDIWGVLVNTLLQSPWGVVHWDGSTWHRVSLPGRPTFPGTDQPVIAFSGKNNGYVLGGDGSSTVYQRSGGSWRVLHVPTSALRGLRVANTYFSDAIPDSTGGFWAALSATNKPVTYRLIHYTGGHWFVVGVPQFRNRFGQVRLSEVYVLARIPGSSRIWVTIDDQSTATAAVPTERILTYQPRR